LTYYERRVPSPPPEDKHTEKAAAIGQRPQACEDRMPFEEAGSGWTPKRRGAIANVQLARVLLGVAMIRFLCPRNTGQDPMGRGFPQEQYRGAVRQEN
jgi:hypothetical protein